MSPPSGTPAALKANMKKPRPYQAGAFLCAAICGNMVSRRGFEPRKNGLTVRKTRHTVLLLCLFGEKCVQLCRRACKAALPDMGIDFLCGCKVCMPHKFHG